MNIKNEIFTGFKYLISAGLCFLVDITLFTIINHFLKTHISSYSIIVATILARIISSFLNYYINRNKVFNVKEGKLDKKSFTKYVTLVIVQMCVSFTSVFIIYNLTKFNETIIKFFVECILFCVNYFIQKLFIFKKD